MDIKDIIMLLLGMLTTLSAGGYFITENRRRKENAEARQSEWGVYKDQLLTAWTEMSKMRDRIDDLEERQDEYAAHIDDLYVCIRQEPDGGKIIIGRLTTIRPGARKKAAVAAEEERKS